MRKNVANIITMIRICLIPVFMWVGGLSHRYAHIIAFVIFFLASLSDGIDGYIARKYDQISNLGKIIDPLADKLLITSALLVFVARGQMSYWPAMIIIAREFAVTSLRVVAVAEGTVIAAGLSGKIKTFVQMVGIGLLLLGFDRVELGVEGLLLGDLVIWIMVAVTVWSGIAYFYGYKDVVKTERSVNK